MSEEVTMNELQKHLLEMMNYFHQVCEEHGLTYYMNSGTVLGAVRHGGFIPWDDDVDLGLMRSDYEKLLQLPDSVWGDRYRLATYHNTPGYPFCYAKLYDITTTKTEDCYGVSEWTGGVYLDIFPHDGAGNHLRLAHLRYWRNFSVLWFLIYSVSEKQYSNRIKRMLQNYAQKKGLLYWQKKLDCILQAKSCENCKYVSNFIGKHRTREVFDKDLFGKGKMYAFADSQFVGPEMTKEYLTQLYGDYMTPPKQSEQVTDHPGFVSLNIGYEAYLQQKKENKNE